MCTTHRRFRSSLILLLAIPLPAIAAVPTVAVHAPDHPLANAAGYVLVERGYEHRVTEYQLGKTVTARGGTLPPDVAGWPLVLPNEWPPRYGAFFVQADADPALEILFQQRKNTRRVHLVDTDGTHMPGWPKTFPQGIASQAGCAFGDIDGDGDGEVVALSDNWPNGSSGWTWAWHTDGSLVAGFPFVTGGDYWGPPTVDDLDGDGRAEVIVSETTWPTGALYVIDGTGQALPGWPVSLGDVPASSAAAVDLDGDGIREIVCEAAYSLCAFHLDGTSVSGFPFALPNGELFSFASPTAADVDGNGTVELAVGCDHQNPTYGRVYLLDHQGSVMPGWPQQTNYWVYTPPTFADIDGDGDVEILVGDSVLGSPVNRVYAWHHDGTSVAGWPSPNMYAINAQITVADVDGDGDQELIWDDNTEFADGTGRLRGYHHDGTALAGWPLETAGSPFFNTTAVADVNGDGDLELLVPASTLLDAFTTVYLWDSLLPSRASLRGEPWHIEMPMYQYGPGHHGRYGGDAGTVSSPTTPEDTPAIALSVGANPVPRSGTTIHFAAPSGAHVELVVFDVGGRARRRIEVGRATGGSGTVTFDARDDGGRLLPSGSYWIQLTVDGETTVQRIVHLR